MRRATSGLFLILGGAYIVAGIALSSAGPLASAGKIATAILLAPLLYPVAPQLVAIFVGIRGAYSSATDLTDIEAKLDWLEREMDEVEQQARSLQERVHRRIQDLSTSDQEPTTPLRLGLFPILQFADRKNCSGSTAATLPHFVVPLSPESRRLQS